MPQTLTYLCPFCDREVRVGGPCPGCEAKAAKNKPARKSWASEPTEDGLNLPDEDFDYDEFVAREFGKSPHKQLGVKWYWWVLGVVALIAMAVLAFGL